MRGGSSPGVHRGIRIPTAALLLAVFASPLLDAAGEAADSRLADDARPALLAASGQGDVELVLWPFSTSESRVFFGDRDAGRTLGENDPLLFWHESVRRFAERRQEVASLVEEQGSALAELSQIGDAQGRRRVNQEGLNNPHRPRIGELIVGWQEKEDAIGRIEDSLRRSAEQVVRRAPGIRDALVELRGRIEEAAAEDGNASDGAAELGKSLDEGYSQRYGQWLSDAIDLMDRIIRQPDGAVETVLSEMDRFAVAESRSKPSPLVRRLEEEIRRLEGVSEYLSYRLSTNERELREVKRLLLNTAETRAVEAEEKAEVESEARREAERRAEEETKARLEAERRADEERQARIEAEQETEESPPSAEESGPKEQVALLEWLGKMGEAVTRIFRKSPPPER